MKPSQTLFELNARERRTRLGLIVSLISVHILLFVWLASQQQRAEAPRSDAVAVIGLSPEQMPAPPKQPKVRPVTPAKLHPMIELEPLLSTDLATMTADPAISDSAGAAGGCAMTDQIRSAIMADPAALAELAALPAGLRTDADAVMLWNGQWFDPGTPPDGVPGGALRTLIERLVAAAPLECRVTPWTGPQFIAIPQGARSTMLVVGSGAWKWQDLIEQAQNCADNGSGNCAPTPPNPASDQLV